jgi:hypothetical protein
MAGLLDSVGAQPKNKSYGKSIHTARFETGLATNRNALHDSASWYVSKYGGYPDAAIDGSNMELSNKLTWIRRPGLSEWSSVAVPDQVNWFYDWRTLDCGIRVVVDTSTSTYLQSSTTQNLIFSKTSGAGQGYYQGVADTLYYGDGIDLQKFELGTDCVNTNGTVWNWGIVAPTTPPKLLITESGAAAVQWQASSMYTTMGLVIDANNHIWQLVAVNNGGSQYGTTGSGGPAWVNTPGATTPDNGHNWTNWGPIGTWQPGHIYNDASTGGSATQPCIIYVPSRNACFIVGNSPTGPGTSGIHMPSFPAGIGQSVSENSGGPGITWFNIGLPAAWAPSHTYPSFGGTALNDQQAGIVEPLSLASGLPVGQTLYWMINDTGSPFTSGASGSQTFPTSPIVGDRIGDGPINPDGTTQLTWMFLGPKGRIANHQYESWTAQGTPFGVVRDTVNGNFHVAVSPSGIGTTGAGNDATVSWGTAYGQQSSTLDGTVTWMCVGTAANSTYASATIWYYPASGFFPPGGAVQYGGALVIDTHTDIEAVVNSGLSQSPGPPSWPAFGSAPGTPTTDNTITWNLVGPVTTSGFSWTKGMSYAISYESRLPTDQFNYAVGTVIPTYPNTVWAGAPPDWPSPLGAPTGAMSGHISTASPLATITGPNPGAVVTLTIPVSPDPQVDTIIIWRTFDGGSTLFFLTEVPNVSNNGLGQVVVKDVSPDSVINNFIEAPIADQNNPPPAGFKPMAYHFERIWGAVGNFVYASGGPDVLAGNPNESFDPLDFFEFPSPVTKIVPTATGILVFLTSDVYAILGGPVFDTFFPTPMVPGVGLLHYNALDVHGGVTFLFTADGQLISMDPSGGAQRMGGLIADKLQLFDPNKVFVTVHESGNDNAIFVSDGSTGWYRLNSSQFPNGSAVWSTFATITNGASAVQSIEVTQGVHRLLVAGVGSSQFILQRDFSTYEDNTTPYTCYVTIGSINFVDPGQIAGLTFTNIRAIRVGSAPTVSYLLNEITGSFTTFPDAQAYPWQIYGATGQPTSLYSNAYYFRDTGAPALAEHGQIKIAFPAENFANEVLSMTIFGTVEQSPEE